MCKKPLNSYIKSIRTNPIKHFIKHNNITASQMINNNYQNSELEKAIIYAETICPVKSKEECKIAWDIVEELSAAIADKKQKQYINDDIYVDLEPTFEDSGIFDL
jgi:hypothetical protein